jgi:hypothetical protein
MPLYRVVSRGENFLLNLTGEPEVLGFRAIHYVKAASEEEAQRTAAILIRKDRRINSALMNTPQNPNRLQCESVKRAWWRRPSRDGRIDFWSMEPDEALP